MQDQSSGSGEASAIDLSADVGAPSYRELVSWLSQSPDSPAVVFDCWARGNFVRRLIHNRNHGVQPILLPAAHPNQMRWAYRRLALAGVPVEFVYTGRMSAPGWRKLWMPLDVPVDCGWGYIVFAGTVVRSSSGREWWPLLGNASLMPRSVVEWLAMETQEAFSEGQVFVAPADLVGLHHKPEERELVALSQVADSALATSDQLVTSGQIDAAIAMLEMQLPWIDGMTPGDFQKLLREHRDDLAEFQQAFRHLVRGYHQSIDDATRAQHRVQGAVTELISSSKRERFRILVQNCKATIKTFPVAMGVLAAAGALYSRDPFAGVAVVGSATKALHDMWVQAKATASSKQTGANRLLLKLGAEKGKFRASSKSRPRSLGRLPATPTNLGQLLEPHWLCPPTGGLRAAVLEEE